MRKVRIMTIAVLVMIVLPTIFVYQNCSPMVPYKLSSSSAASFGEFDLDSEKILPVNHWYDADEARIHLTAIRREPAALYPNDFTVGVGFFTYAEPGFNRVPIRQTYFRNDASSFVDRYGRNEQITLGMVEGQPDYNNQNLGYISTVRTNLATLRLLQCDYRMTGCYNGNSTFCLNNNDGNFSILTFANYCPVPRPITDSFTTTFLGQSVAGYAISPMVVDGTVRNPWNVPNLFAIDQVAGIYRTQGRIFCTAYVSQADMAANALTHVQSVPKGLIYQSGFSSTCDQAASTIVPYDSLIPGSPGTVLTPTPTPTSTPSPTPSPTPRPSATPYVSTCGGTQLAGFILQTSVSSGSSGFRGVQCGGMSGTNRQCFSCTAHWVYDGGAPNGDPNQTISCACDAPKLIERTAGSCGGTLESGAILNKGVSGGNSTLKGVACGGMNGNKNLCKSCNAHWEYDGGVFNSNPNQGISCLCD